MIAEMVLVKCRWCGADCGEIEQGAKYSLKCPRGCKARTCGVA